MRIFTKRFFASSPRDQVQIVDAALADLEECVGRSPDKAGRGKARRMIREITRKAVEYGVYQTDEKNT